MPGIPLQPTELTAAIANQLAALWCNDAMIPLQLHQPFSHLALGQQFNSEMVGGGLNPTLGDAGKSWSDADGIWLSLVLITWHLESNTCLYCIHTVYVCMCAFTHRQSIARVGRSDRSRWIFPEPRGLDGENWQTLSAHRPRGKAADTRQGQIHIQHFHMYLPLFGLSVNIPAMYKLAETGNMKERRHKKEYYNVA